MKQDQVIADISALLRARNTLLWIVSREELRVERALTGVAETLNMVPLFWDCADGMSNADSTPNDASLSDPLGALQAVGAQKRRALYVMRDLHKWMDPLVLRSLRSLARKLQGAPRNQARAIIILSPSSEIPPELAGQATVLDWPLPDREEMGAILDSIVESLDDELRSDALPVNGARDAAIDAAVGLTADEAANSYARSLVTERRIDPALVSAEKQRVIARERVLTWHDPDPRGLDAVGGLDVLKTWLTSRRSAFGAKARAYGLPTPKGVLLLGPPGTGKSLTAKAVATAWEQPLLRLDMGALKSKFVGESEANIRKALQVAETVAPCVLWVDEIEKSLAGSTGPQGDGGVGADALGTLLSWMQDRAESVFIVATANDVTSLPPELLRKGRFDELFFIDLPNEIERQQILATTLRYYGRDISDDDMATGDVGEAILSETEGFTGAEIAALIPDALYTSFADDERPLTLMDVLEAAKGVVPLSTTAKEKIDGLREWASSRCRFASTQTVKAAAGAERNIEL
jgi:SpoVK/Ycf46/Vps4 family AAA+-type ATPase